MDNPMTEMPLRGLGGKYQSEHHMFINPLRGIIAKNHQQQTTCKKEDTHMLLLNKDPKRQLKLLPL
jgi:hypothetical protein